MRTVFAATLLALCSCSPSSTSVPQRSRADVVDVVIENVAVRSMAASGSALEPPRDVFIKDGVITAIEPTGMRSTSAAGRVIDGTDLTLIPGLADMHIHLWDERDLIAYLAHGVTTVRNMWGTPRDLATKRRVASGELLGPRIITAGALTDGDPPVWEASTVARTPEEIRAQMDQEKAAGYDFLKVYSNMSKEVFDAAIQHGQTIGYRVGGHVPRTVPIADAIASGMWTIEHFTGWGNATEAENTPLPRYDPTRSWEEQKAEYLEPIFEVQRGEREPTDFYDIEKVVELAKLCAESGSAQVPTLVTEYYQFASKEARKAVLQRDEIRYINPVMYGSWNTDSLRAQDEDDTERTVFAALLPEKLSYIKALYDSGAYVLTGSDAPNPYVMPGYSIHEELALFVQAGLTPEQALATATRRVAEFLGELSERGTLEVGKVADAVLLENDPFEDIAATRGIVGVLIGGRYLDRAQLDEELERVEQEWQPPEDFFATAPVEPNVEWAQVFDSEVSGMASGATRFGSIEGDGTRRVSQSRRKIGYDIETVTTTYYTENGRIVELRQVFDGDETILPERRVTLSGGTATVYDAEGQSIASHTNIDTIACEAAGCFDALSEWLMAQHEKDVRIAMLDSSDGDLEILEGKVAVEAGAVRVAFAQRSQERGQSWELILDAQGVERIERVASFVKMVLSRREQ